MYDYRNEDKYDDLDELLDDLIATVEHNEKLMNEKQYEVYSILADHIEDIPYRFFEKPLAELNRWFGGKGDRAVDELVRSTMCALQRLDEFYDDGLSVYDDLPEEDPEDEE